MHLEDLIRDCVRRGELSSLSITSNASGKGFYCSYAPCSAFGITIIHGPDPVALMHEAITSTKLRKGRAAVQKPNAEVAAQGTNPD